LKEGRSEVGALSGDGAMGATRRRGEPRKKEKGTKNQRSEVGGRKSEGRDER